MLARDLVRVVIAAELIIFDFRTFFVLTWTILPCMFRDMRKAANQNIPLLLRHPRLAATKRGTKSVIKSSVFAVGSALNGNISSLGFLLSCKGAKVEAFAPNRSTGGVCRALLPDTNYATQWRRRGNAISHVLEARSLSQINKSIVGAIAIDVVNLCDRPPTMDVKPDEPVRVIGSCSNDNAVATALINRACDPADKVRLPMARSCEEAGGFVIAERSSQFVSGERRARHCLGHQMLRWASKTTKEQHEQSNRDAARDRADEENAKDHREYVNQRLRELTAFERKVGGKN
jgi:hypothetical protein